MDGRAVGQQGLGGQLRSQDLTLGALEGQKQSSDKAGMRGESLLVLKSSTWAALSSTTWAQVGTDPGGNSLGWLHLILG